MRPAPLEWLCLLAGAFFVLHYAWLLDDAFVYFRYADNLLWLGHGLVYNRGEHVEGFTSPLWMLLLIALRWTTLDYWLLVRLAGLVSFAWFWWTLVALNRDWSPRSARGARIVNAPLLALTCNYAVACYFTSGVEAPLALVAAVAYARFVARPDAPVARIIVALSPLVRPELALPFALVVVWSWLVARRAFWWLLAIGGGVIAAWLTFRVIYYADLLPNTFYLKHLADADQGWRYLADTARPYFLYPLLGAFGVLALIAKVTATRRGVGSVALGRRALLLTIAAAVAGYVIYIGGDPRHFRYLAFPFCLAVAAGAGLLEHVLNGVESRVRPAFVIALGLAFGFLVTSRYPQQLGAHPIGVTVPHRRVHKINDAKLHRRHPALMASPWQLEPAFEQRDLYAAFLAERPRRRYRGVMAAHRCVQAFKSFDRRVVHSLGLTDAVLARTEMKVDRPGHKLGLIELGRALARLQRQVRPGRGFYDRAMRRKVAPRWIVDNYDTIQVIQQKVHNDHGPLENLKLAFTFPPRVRP